MSIGSDTAQGAAYGSVAGPLGTAVGAGLGALKGAFGSGRDGGAGYAPQHGGFSGPGYGKPGTPGFDANGLPYDQNNPAPGGAAMGNDPRTNAFNWRGDPNGAAGDVRRYQGMGTAWGNIQSPGNDYGQANGYAGMGDQARGSQTDALGMLRTAATGSMPSAAEIQMRQGNDQAMANSLGLAAGARGAASMAGATQQAMGNNSAMATNNINNMGSLRANEMANARNAYMGGATGMRGQDLGFYGQASNNAQANGQLGLGYRQLGLQGQLGFEGMGYNVNRDQYAGQQALYGANDANFNAQQQRNNQSQANANQNYDTAISGAANIIAAKAGQK